MIHIDNYKDKKLIDYIIPGDNVLIRFGHGLGDTIMFVPIFKKIVNQYPDCNISLYVECGQEEMIEIKDYVVKKPKLSDYDYVFDLHFPMSEGTDLTKP